MNAIRLFSTWAARFAVWLVLCSCIGCSSGVFRSTNWAKLEAARSRLQEFGGSVSLEDENEFSEGSLIVVQLQDCRNADAGLSRLDGFLVYDALCLHGSKLTQSGIDAIAKQKTLRHLHFNDTNVTDEILHPVNGLNKLVMLQLDRTKITDKGLAQLGDLSELHNLGLGGTEITDAGLAYLTRYPKLQDLFLDDTKITGDGLAHLTALPRLESLHLGRTRIGDVGLKHLEGLKSLEWVSLEGAQVSPAGIASLQAKRPNCRIIR